MICIVPSHQLHHVMWEAASDGARASAHLEVERGSRSRVCDSPGRAGTSFLLPPRHHHVVSASSRGVPRAEARARVLSRGGQEVQRGPSEEIRDVPFRGRGPLVRARPRRLRRALRRTRHRHSYRGRSWRLKRKGEKKKEKSRSRRGRVEK